MTWLDRRVGLADMLSTGASYREIDYWARTGALTPDVRAEAGSGHVRPWTVRDVLTVALILRLRRVGLRLDVAAALAVPAVEYGTNETTIDGVTLRWSQEETG